MIQKKRQKPVVRVVLSIATIILVAGVSRCRAASIVWTNTAGGNWNVTNNWSPNHVPGSSDDAYITNNDTYAVTLNAAATVNSLTIGGTSGTQYFTNNSQTLTLNGDSVVNGNGVLVFGGGTINGAGNLTVNGALMWTGGTMSGAGTTIVNSGFTISGATGKSLTTRTLVNTAAAVWSGGQITFSSSCVLSNTSSGTFDCAFDGTLQNSGAGGTVANAGLFRKTAGTGTTTFGNTVAINNSGSVEVDTGTLSLGGGGTSTGPFTALAGATLDLGGGTHNFSTAATVTGAGSFSVSGGTATLAGPISVATTNSIGSGTANILGDFGGAGSTLNISSGGTANFNGSGTIAVGAVNLTGGVLGGSNTVTVAGPMTWTAGTITGTNSVIANGGLTISGVTGKALTTRTLVNTAAAVWSGGQITFTAGGVLSNASSGTFDCAFDGTMQNSGAGGTVANAGLFRKTAGTGTTTFGNSVAINNSGSVEVQTGALSLGGGGTSTGPFTVLAGATLDLGGGTHNFSAAATVTGAGSFSVSGATANLAGAINVATTNSISNGTANILADFGGAGSTLNISGGTANFNGSGTIAVGTVNFTGGILGGSNSITASGPMLWTAGTITGTNSVIANGGLTISGVTGKALTTRTLVNTAAAVWSGGQITFTAGGVLSNASSGTFDCAFDGTMQNSGAGGTVANAGLFRKTTGTGTTLLGGSVVINNSGSVEVDTGTLSLSGGGTSSGTFTTLAGAILDLQGTHNFSAASTVTGAGTFSVSSGTANLAGSLNVTGTNSFSGGTANFSGSYTISGGTLNISGGTASFNGDGVITPGLLNLTGGTLGGSNNVTVGSPMIWSGGNISGTNSVIANGGLTISGATGKSLTGRTLVNAAAAVWSGGQITFIGGSILSNSPSGTFDCAFDGTLTISGGLGGTVVNAGLLRKTAGSGATTVSGPAFNNNGSVEVQSGSLAVISSSLYIQNAGLTLLDGGNITVGSTMQIRGGTLGGTGTIAGSVTNNGVTSPGSSPGQLIITGKYIQTANGTLNIELAGTVPGTSFDSLIVSNTATLAGTLNVTLTNGFYPAHNSLYTFLTNATRSGTFTSVNYPSNVVGLQIDYTATNATIEIINTLPNVPAISNQVMDELTPLSFNVNATDSDVPAQALTYSLINSPTNAGIDSSGLLQWTPTEAQGPMTTNITVVVTDNGTPNLSTTNTFQVMVNEINVAPVLTLPANSAFNEQTLYTNNAVATDSDIPSNSLTFALVSGPTGLNVSPAGAISWTPDESQGSNSYTIFVSVTDYNPDAVNAQHLSTTNSFTLTVNEVNVAPVLTVPANTNINELTLYTNNATATDADIPANTLTFAVVSGPTNLTVSPAGAISWTPSEAQGPSTNLVQISVTDFNPLAVNAQHLSVTNSFTITVNEVNTAPVLTVPANTNINELAALTVTNTATDSDVPANPLTFSLLSPLTGMAINATNGVFTWTPTEAQGPSTNIITVVVTDTNSFAVNAKSLSTTNTFRVVVNEVNVAPVLTVPANTNINELATLTVTNSATDSDIPANTLTFSLVSPLTGMAINATNGVFTWTPTEAQGPTTNTITVVVTDTNVFAVNATSLSVTNSFNVVVNEVNVAPVLGALTNWVVNAGQTVSFTATATDSDVPANTLTFGLASPPGSAIINSASGLFNWRPTVSQANTTNTVQVQVTDFNPYAVNSQHLSDTKSFTVIVHPLATQSLASVNYTNGHFTLQVNGTSGPDYIIAASTNLTQWVNLFTNLSATTPFQYTDTNANSFRDRFYRIQLSP